MSTGPRPRPRSWSRSAPCMTRTNDRALLGDKLFVARGRGRRQSPVAPSSPAYDHAVGQVLRRDRGLGRRGRREQPPTLGSGFGRTPGQVGLRDPDRGPSAARIAPEAHQDLHAVGPLGQGVADHSPGNVGRVVQVHHLPGFLVDEMRVRLGHCVEHQLGRRGGRPADQPVGSASSSSWPGQLARGHRQAGLGDHISATSASVTMHLRRGAQQRQQTRQGAVPRQARPGRISLGTASCVIRPPGAGSRCEVLPSCTQRLVVAARDILNSGLDIPVHV